MKNILSSLFLCIGFGVFANPDSCKLSLDGHIFDRDNKEELPFTIIILLPENLFVTSDEHGAYSFHKVCPGKHSIVLSHANCKPDTLAIQIDQLVQHKDFYLAHAATNLNEIKVEHLKAEHDPNLGGRHIHNLDIITHQASSLASIAENLNGVRNLNSGANIQKPILNGLSGSRLQIVQDGIRLESQQWGQDHAPEWVASDVSGMYILRGPQTLTMGPDAFGNILMVEPPSLPVDKQITGQFGLAYASVNQKLAAKTAFSGYFSKKRNIGFHLNASYSKAGNTKTPDYYQKNTGFREVNVSASLHYTLKNAKLILGYKSFIQKTGILASSHIGNLTDLNNAIESDTPFETAGFTYFIDRPYQSILHQTAFFKAHIPLNVKNHIHFQYAYQNNRRDEFDKLRGASTSIAANSFYLQTHQISAEWDREAKIHTHVTGIQSTIQVNDFGGAYFIPKYTYGQIGIFNIEKWTYKKWDLQAGIRYDFRNFLVHQLQANNDTNINAQYHGISGSLAVYYHFTNHLTLSFESGRSWRAPNAVELYSRGLHHGAASIENGNPNLNAETAWFFSIQNVFTQGNRHFLDFQFYYRYYPNFNYLQPLPNLVLTVRGAFPSFEYKQTNAHVYGLNAQYSVQLPLGFFQSLNLQYIRAIQVQSKEEIPFTPPARLSYAIGWKYLSDARIQNASISVKLEYTSTQNRVNYNTEIKAPPKAFTLLSLDAHLQTLIAKQKITFAIQCNNMLNTKYRDYLNRWRYFTDEAGANVQLSVFIPLTIKS